MVRAFYMSGGQRKFGPWSNVEYITPSPTKLTAKNTSSGTNLKMNIKWNIIYGCNGYNVFLTTNPNGTWYWNQSTSIKADAASAAITKYRGSKLKRIPATTSGSSQGANATVSSALCPCLHPIPISDPLSSNKKNPLGDFRDSSEPYRKAHCCSLPS